VFFRGGKALKVLALGNKDLSAPYELSELIESLGDEPIAYHQRFDLDFLEQNKIEFIVSYRYRFLIKEPILTAFQNRVINLHPSLLPWCRGYYPNFWSFYDDTPRGVTIHQIDETIDTGNVIVQEELFFNDKNTLRETYDVCHHTMLSLFKENWEIIRTGSYKSFPQDKNAGTLHLKEDFTKIQHHLPRGWDTTIAEIRRMKWNASRKV